MDQIRIGITGSSGSGKSTIAHELAKNYEQKGIVCQVISLDNFYRDSLDKSTTNWDDPDTFDSQCFEEFLMALRNSPGQPVVYPKFNFDTSRRETGINFTNPNASFFIFEGIFAHHPAIKHLYTKTIFVETDLNLCFERRKVRDMSHRGHSEEQVIAAWKHHVLPGYTEHILPHKAEAHIVVSNDETNRNLSFDLSEIIRAIDAHKAPRASQLRYRMFSALGQIVARESREDASYNLCS